jgi:hypothetical protein
MDFTARAWLVFVCVQRSTVLSEPVHRERWCVCALGKLFTGLEDESGGPGWIRVIL